MSSSLSSTRRWATKRVWNSSGESFKSPVASKLLKTMCFSSSVRLSDVLVRKEKTSSRSRYPEWVSSSFWNALRASIFTSGKG
eukprot:1360818-Amorphochlora_amoeboformis.AAC.3